MVGSDVFYFGSMGKIIEKESLYTEVYEIKELYMKRNENERKSRNPS